jgi:hypothetical protein
MTTKTEYQQALDESVGASIRILDRYRECLEHVYHLLKVMGTYDMTASEQYRKAREYYERETGEGITINNGI